MLLLPLAKIGPPHAVSVPHTSFSMIELHVLERETKWRQNAHLPLAKIATPLGWRTAY
jgi:hypothetical protein